MNEPETELLSIGGVAQATAISPDTIRVWERRYGRPVPVRLPSGHRRYRREDVRWLRRIAEALALGHRPSRVIPLSDSELGGLIAPGREERTADESTRRFLDLVRGYEDVTLRTELLEEIERIGPRSFVTDRLSPLLTAVGRAWSDGELSIRHEHFATEIIEDILRRLRESMYEPSRGPVVLLTTLVGEHHGLGLQMAGVLASLAGARPSILGTDTPNEEIVAAARDTCSDAVSVSVSLSTAGVATDRVLGELRRLLPATIPLVVGGAGARGVRRGPRGIVWISDLREFEAWIGSELPGGEG